MLPTDKGHHFDASDVVIWGCPFHGLAKNGSLTLPNNDSIAYPQPPHGGTQLVRVPGFPAVSRTPEQQVADDAKGYQWLNYAVVGGGILHGQGLGDNWIVYIDGNGIAWNLTFSIAKGATGIDIEVTLVGLFGRFGIPEADENANIVKASLTHPYAQAGDFAGTNAWPEFAAERASDGSDVLINLYWTADPVSTPLTAAHPAGMVLADVYRLQISGDGARPSVDPGSSLGAGIAVNISVYKANADVYGTDSIVDVQQALTSGTYGSAMGSHTTSSWNNYSGPVECPDCSGVRYYGFENEPDAVDYTNVNQYQNRETRLLRCLFDENDSIVEYAIRRTWGVYVDEDSARGGIYHNEHADHYRPDADPCADCVLDYTDDLSWCTIFETVTIKLGSRVLWETLRNGSAVDSALWLQYTKTVTQWDCWVHAGDVVTGHNEFDGQEIPVGDAVGVSPAFSSPQLCGLIARFVDEVPATYDIRAVATPDGSDGQTAQDLLETAFPSKINGSYQPVTKAVTRLTDDAIAYV